MDTACTDTGLVLRVLAMSTLQLSLVLSWYSLSLPRRDGQAELSLTADEIPTLCKRDSNQRTVTHPSTDVEQLLIVTNELPS